MKTFLTENFLLETETARQLYFDYAAPQPIFDYHCHLPPAQIASNYQFRNLYDIWLAGDHYKWRAMRSNGIAEEFCTGAASDREKFDAFIRTVPYTLRNPIYHWCHLELLRYFGIDLLINEANAEAIWNQANERLQSAEMRTQGILRSQKVAVVGTTDDPTDTLEFHQQIKAQGLTTRVYPTFRPDKALLVHQPAALNAWCDRLSELTDCDCQEFSQFLTALKKRHDFFHELGGRLSDHGLESCFHGECTETEARVIFQAARAGQAASPEEHDKFGNFMMLYFGELDAAKGWTKQLHLGAMRANNTRLFRSVGADIGCDSISDLPQARSLSKYLDTLDQRGHLPQVVIYNLNPADNYVMATMIGNFQGGGRPGKIQFGSGWWFLDQKEGMEWQLNALSQLGLLRRFVGMLTDSRSFLSYTRHEYFRRILCNILGNEVEKGLLPRDTQLIGSMVKEICFSNALDYFGQEIDSTYA